jgi:hypothetical protein
MQKPAAVSMANLADPNLLANLATELDRVAKVCRLPHGWMAKPSFRLTPQGASLLVVWHPATTAARESARPRASEKKKRRSKAARERSAARAAGHEERKKTQQSANSRQQGLDPASRVFSPNVPIPPAPNPVQAAAVFPAAEESERVVDRMEGVQRARFDVPHAIVPVSQPGPAPQHRRGEKRELSDREWQADMYGCQHLILELWGREETQGEAWHASCRTLDSLAGAGTAQKLINNLNLRARQIDKYG